MRSPQATFVKQDTESGKNPSIWLVHELIALVNALRSFHGNLPIKEPKFTNMTVSPMVLFGISGLFKILWFTP
jgi:hypothetical protein